jgi:putative hydroxymethylpyrimidine transport system substrate-binding protein
MSQSRIGLASRAVVLLAAALACSAVSGCGDGGGATQPSIRDATLVLDFVPGPVHAGIYEALAAGYYADEGIDLEVIEPTSTADTLKLIDAGKAEIGIADGLDVAGQIDAGRGAKAIMAIAREPLGGIITLARSGFESPAELEGRTIGVTGVPSDDAILDTVVAAAGAEPDVVDRVTIGFNGVQSLEAGKVDGFTGFVPADGVQADVDGYPTRSFGPRRYGGLTYPGLVAFSTEPEIAEEPDLVRGFVAATARGYEDVLADPAAGVDALLDANPAIDPDFARRSLDAYLPYLRPRGRPFGSIDRGSIEGMSDFMVESGLIDSPIPPGRYAADEFAETVGDG